jgi:hypothetical protein
MKAFRLGRGIVNLLVLFAGKAVEASQLRPGNHWKILVHDDTPEEIRAE